MNITENKSGTPVSAKDLLETRLKKLREFYSSKLSEGDNEKMERHIDFLRKSGAVDHILKVGDTAPVFKLKNQHNTIIDSTELLKNGPLVVSFYRGSWCPYCVEEVKYLNKYYTEIKDAGANLVVISPQSFSRTEKQASEIKLQYSMLVDADNTVGKAFGLVYEFPQYLKDLYQGTFGNNIQDINEGTAWELPIPARFVVGQGGIIQDVKADPDYRFRPEPIETINFLKKHNN
ncbi:peroxiredoxin-like family protein [Flavobacterium subsaxonicum]|uniref:peroxiredoxin-like family protein n=1 Tax=Flavobacterium subsaxonicum TaxID=426226 RepID=UPI000408038C|nr:peroxiredoxin-like family protein [Flavobacterium subsaxonicum]